MMWKIAYIVCAMMVMAPIIKVKPNSREGVKKVPIAAIAESILGYVCGRKCPLFIRSASSPLGPYVVTLVFQFSM